MRYEYIERPYSIPLHQEYCNGSQSLLTEHLEQLHFNLLNLVRFGEFSNLLIGVLSRATIPFNANETQLEFPMQYKTHREGKMEETRDE